jgi:hypothetical protein
MVHKSMSPHLPRAVPKQALWRHGAADISLRIASARRISSAVEQRFCKPKVGGSIPSSGTNDINMLGQVF